MRKHLFFGSAVSSSQMQSLKTNVPSNAGLGAVSTRVFCLRFSVRDGATAQLFPTRDHVREKQRKQLGNGAIADRETDAKKAIVDGP
jgi:hypothetical protein